MSSLVMADMYEALMADEAGDGTVCALGSKSVTVGESSEPKSLDIGEIAPGSV